MYYLHCFMCNTLLKQKDTCSNSVPFSFVEKVLLNVWKFPHYIFSSSNNTNSVTSCKKCVSKLRRISKVYFQLQTLQNLLTKLKTEIEECVLQVTDDDANNINMVITRALLEGFGESLPVSGGDANDHEQHLRTGDDRFLRSKFLEGLSILKGQSVPQLNSVEVETQTDEDPETSETLKSKLKSICRNDSQDYTEKMQSILVEGEETHELELNSSANDSTIYQDDLEDEDDIMGPEVVEERLQCGKCNCSVKDEIARFAHWRKRHEGDKYPYHCDKCTKRFATRKQYTIHIMGHEGVTPFICEHCGRGFRLEKLLTFHLKNKHISGGREFKCNVEQCTWEFTTASKLKAHLDTHSKQSLPCHICNKIFCSTTALNVHLVQHSSSNPWKCSHCGKTFSCNSTLKNHSALHSQNYKFRCDLCPFGGSSKSDLQRHMVSHTIEKGFRCGICENEFKYKKSLSKHLKVHAGLKNCSCHVCGKSFIDNYKLRRHTKIHEGIRPFNCDEDGCDKSFYTKDALIVHKKCHTTNEASGEHFAESSGKSAHTRKSKRLRSKKTRGKSKSNSTSNEKHHPLHETSIIMIENEAGRRDESFGVPSSSSFVSIIEDVQLPMTMQFMQVQEAPLSYNSSLSHIQFPIISDSNIIQENTSCNTVHELESSAIFSGSIFQFEYLAP